MLEKFKKNIEEKKLCNPEDKLLLAVSGGIDSMAMLQLFLSAGYSPGVAHCNFKLRADESNADEAFVISYTQKHQIPLHLKSFDTRKFAGDQDYSLQMAARELRYQWFEDICELHGYNHIAIAHNKNDVLETFFINLTRGAGIHGLTGIKEKQGKIIRPLLFAFRKEIEDYCRLNNIPFCEDSSNRSVKYTRNFIRHKILPLFQKINPSFDETLSRNIQNLRDTEMVLNEKISKEKRKVMQEKNGRAYIHIEKIKKLQPLNIYLFEFIREFGFPPEMIPDIIKSLDGIPGKQFKSEKYRLIRDRKHLIIFKHQNGNEKEVFIEPNTKSISSPVKLKFQSYPKNKNFNIAKKNEIATLDYDKLDFPLIIRKWKHGDSFYPLGMKNRKKLSDFFVDQKVSLMEKEQTLVIESKGKIAWIAGKRIDDRFKITKKTRNIFEITLLTGE